MAIYDDQDNLLVLVDPVYLCDDLVGYECKYAGYYSFDYYRLRLPYPSESSSSLSGSSNSNNNYDDNYNYGGSSSSGSSSSTGQFLPRISMAFSTRADSGYNLGALNFDYCPGGADEENFDYWIKNKPSRSPLETFFIDYGLLLAACSVVIGVSVFLWKQASKTKTGVDALNDTVDSNYKSIGVTSIL